MERFASLRRAVISPLFLFFVLLLHLHKFSTADSFLDSVIRDERDFLRFAGGGKKVKITTPFRNVILLKAV